MEADKEELSAAPTQPAQQNVSEDGGAERVGTFRDELTEVLEELKKQLKEVQEQATRQLCKRVSELETRTGTDLGTDSADNVTDNTTIQDSQLRKHYSDWTNGSQVRCKTSGRLVSAGTFFETLWTHHGQKMLEFEGNTIP
eukprot:2869930-Rhodomonas_salina.3